MILKSENQRQLLLNIINKGEYKVEDIEIIVQLKSDVQNARLDKSFGIQSPTIPSPTVVIGQGGVDYDSNYKIK